MSSALGGGTELSAPRSLVEPGADLVLLVRRVIVEDHVDGLVRRHPALDAAGVSLTQALAEFVQLVASPDQDNLRDEARRQAEENPPVKHHALYPGRRIRQGPREVPGIPG